MTAQMTEALPTVLELISQEETRMRREEHNLFSFSFCSFLTSFSNLFTLDWSTSTLAVAASGMTGLDGAAELGMVINEV